MPLQVPTCLMTQSLHDTVKQLLHVTGNDSETERLLKFMLMFVAILWKCTTRTPAQACNTLASPVPSIRPCSCGIHHGKRIKILPRLINESPANNAKTSHGVMFIPLFMRSWYQFWHHKDKLFRVKGANIPRRSWPD